MDIVVHAQLRMYQSRAKKEFGITVAYIIMSYGINGRLCSFFTSGVLILV